MAGKNSWKLETIRKKSGLLENIRKNSMLPGKICECMKMQEKNSENCEW